MTTHHVEPVLRPWVHGSVRRAYTVVATQFRLGILHELQYRGHAMLQVWATLVAVAAAVMGIATTFSHAEELGGWTQYELLTLVGLHLAVGGFIGTVIKPSLKLVMEQVREGTFDYVLARPTDSLLLGMTQNIDPWRFVDVIAGLVLVSTGIMGMGGVDVLVAFGAAVVAVSGTVSLTALWVVLTTLTFRFVRVGELLDIAHATYEGGRWPVGLQAQWLRIVFILAVPVGVAVSVPAAMLSGSMSSWVLPAAIGQGLVAATCARITWQRTVRTYSGASA